MLCAGVSDAFLAGDLFNASVFFELMSVVAYALTGFRIDEAKAVQGALTFGVVNSLGAYAMLTGIGLLHARIGKLWMPKICLFYTYDAADDMQSLDVAGCRFNHKINTQQ